MASDLDPAMRLRYAERAVVLAPDLPLWVINLGFQLVHNKQPARARSLAARLLQGGG